MKKRRKEGFALLLLRLTALLLVAAGGLKVHFIDVGQLDLVVATHPHSDHIGGLDEVPEDFRADKLLLPPVDYNSWSYRHLLETVEGEEANDWSVAIRITYGDTAFVLTGDAGAAAETDMFQSGLKLGADVLKLGHHGSGNSTCREFLAAVSPEAVVVSCGKDNPYEYPHRVTLEKVRGLEAYRTGLQGTVTAFSDGRLVIWDTDPFMGADETAERKNNHEPEI